MSEPKIVDLVFEGGGMKGVAFIGAIRALATFGYRPGRLLGTSVGSLYAFLIAAGYSADELFDQIIDSKTGALRLTQHIRPVSHFENLEIDASATRRLLREVDFHFIPNWLEDGVDTKIAYALMHHPGLNNLFAFIEKGGTKDPEPFMKWLGELLEAKITLPPDTPPNALTLAQFHKINGCMLSLIAADVTNPTMLILNHITAPDCPIVQAVRMATAVSPLFPPVVWKSEWGLYRRQQLTGDSIVDGGILSNFPIELFLSQLPAVTDMMGTPDAKAEVLGLILDEGIAVPGAPKKATPKWQLLMNDFPGLTLLGDLIRTAIEARDKRAIESAAENVVRLPTMGYQADAFDLSLVQLQPLINAGYNSMVSHLEMLAAGAVGRTVSKSKSGHADNAAMQIINVAGNLISVVQTIGEVSGSATGLSSGTIGEK